MKMLRMGITVWIWFAAVCWLHTQTLLCGQTEGVAVAIVYDTSGSMAERVGLSPKYQIANRALTTIVDRINNYATNKTTPKPIHAGLFVFENSSVTEVIRFGAFDAVALKQWLKRFNQPSGGTPLGLAVEAASRRLMQSPFLEKHIMVITDGLNTVGADPTSVLPQIQKQASKSGQTISVHFIAFDIAARVFDPLRKQGYTVVAAANEKQLNDQLQFILEEKIMLEKEEPKKK